MKTILTALSLFTIHFSLITPALAQLDEAYHTNAEIEAVLRTYAEDYPDWMTLDSIGHSAEDSLPIWCVKISDNPDRIEPEAALLFIGQVHAEEVVGIEIALEIMKMMLDNNEENAFRQRLEGLEIYIIPTANPEGLDVVHSGLDVTFRKNKRDNVGDGVLRIQDGEGWDTSGVDLNRNFGTHWDRGDTLYRPENNLRYNAYRGSGPFSEPESRAIRDLALSRPFLYSIVYHSSRTGNSTELFIAPWFWRDNVVIKRPPDFEAINALGVRLAGMIPKMRDRNGHYRPVQSMQRKGQLQDWFYVETGCIQFMAEVSADIQPAEDTMRMVVADNLPAVWYMMDLALGLEGLDGFGTLTVMTSSDQGWESDYATIEIDGGTPPILKPRKTHHWTGRFDWLLPAGEHSISIKRYGHETLSWANYNIPDGERTVLEAEIRQIRLYDVWFSIVRPSDRNAFMRLYSERNEMIGFTQLSEMPLGFRLSPGDYYSTISADGYVPLILPFLVENHEVDLDEIEMTPGNAAYSESFSEPANYPHEGDNWGVKTFDGRSCLTESVVGDYASDSDVWLTLPNIVRLDTARATMRIIHLPYAEPQDDYQQIEWWTNPDEVWMKRYSQLRAFRRPPADDGPEEPDWDTLYVSLDGLDRGDLSVRFRTVSDGDINEDGWLIDEVAVFVEGYVNSVPQDEFHLPSSLFHVWPNPFNSSVTISFSIWGGQAFLPVALRIYDLQGRLVKELINGQNEAGEHKVVWEAGDFGSGIYVVRLEAGGKTAAKKIVLVR